MAQGFGVVILEALALVLVAGVQRVPLLGAGGSDHRLGVGVGRLGVVVRVSLAAAGAAAVHEVVAQGFGVVVLEALALVLVAGVQRVALLGAGGSDHSLGVGVGGFGPAHGLAEENLHRIGGVAGGVIIHAHRHAHVPVAQDVGAVAFRSHPQIQEILRGGRALDVGDVLTHILIGTGDRREAGRSVGAGVAEVLDQLTGAGVGRGLFRTGGQLAQPVVLAGLVGQGRHIGCLDGVLIRFVGLVAAVTAAAAAVVMVTSLIGVVVLLAAVLAVAGPAVLGLAVIAGLLVRDLHRTAVLGGGGRGGHRVLVAGIRPRPGFGLRQVIVLPAAGILGGRGILLRGIVRGFRCVFVVIGRFVGRFFLHRLGHARRGCRIRLIVRPEGQTGSNAHAQKGGSGQNRNNRFDIHGIPLFPAFAAVMIFRNGLDIVFAEHDISSLLPVASIQNGIGLFGEGPVFRPSDYLLGTGKSASSRGEKVFFNVFSGVSLFPPARF